MLAGFCGVEMVSDNETAARVAAHRKWNFVQSIALVACLAVLMAVSAFLLWSWTGAIVAVLVTAAVWLLAPRLPPEMLMRLYRAQLVDPRHGQQLLAMVAELAARAELPSVPKTYVIPSATLNAFASGRRDHAAVAITEGLLRKLELRQLAAVIAHEISHVDNGDLEIMSIADVMSRITQLMSYGAIGLLVWHLPTIFTGEARIPWLAIVLLYLSPAIGNLLQLGLSRSREYDADASSVALTGDPEALASALAAIQHYQGHMWEDVMVPGGRRIPHPSVLRSHPTTERRIRRLAHMDGVELPAERRRPRLNLRDEPMVTMIGVGHNSIRPRYRWPGLWY